MIPWLRRSLLRLAAYFHRARLDQDRDAEMVAHLELAISENLQNGMSPDEARRQALIHFGGAQETRERHRGSRSLPALDELFQDLRFGLRMLRKNSGFTTIAVLALALGIGFSSTVFSIFYNGVLYPFPYRDAQRLTVIGIVDTENSDRFGVMFTLDEIASFRKQTQGEYNREPLIWEVGYPKFFLSDP